MHRAFGAENRAVLFAKYFGNTASINAAEAWLHVYRLLLWIDRTTGLVHCYESDKSQPGRHWYGRSLAFHSWLSGEMGVSPTALGVEIDWLFRRAVDDFAKAMIHQKANRAKAASLQRAAFDGKGMPEPGDDPELIVIIKEALEKYLASAPPDHVWKLLMEEISAHYTQENKRRNLVGEAFEDLIAELVRRIPAVTKLSAGTRVPIQNVSGFSAPSAKDKEKKVDVVIQRTSPARRILVTAKWSIRADREEQFASDYDAYVKLENAAEVFDYVLVTNEFDPARLLAACDRLSQNNPLFKHVVHVNPQGLLKAYGESPERSASKIVQHIASGRLISLGDWLSNLAA